MGNENQEIKKDPTAGDQNKGDQAQGTKEVTIDVAAYQEKIKELEDQIKEKEDLLAKAEEDKIQLQERVEDLENQLDEKNAAIIEHVAKIKKLEAGEAIEVKAETKPAKEKPTIPQEPVVFEEKKYRFRFAAFYFEAVRYTAQDAANDPALIKKILNTKGQGILIEVF